MREALRYVVAFAMSSGLNVGLVVTLAELDAPPKVEDPHEDHLVRPSVVEPPEPPNDVARSEATAARPTPLPSAPELPEFPLPGLPDLGSGAALRGPGLAGLGLEGIGSGFEAGLHPQERDSNGSRTPPQLASSPDLARFYPRAARRRGLGGRSMVEIEVGPDGRVRSVRILRSEPPGLFDDAAVRAAKSLRFEPAHGSEGEVAGVVRLELGWKPST